jgi:hypothetical protein
MANGDAAAAAGLHVVAPTDDARNGYSDINIRGDELALHMTSGTHRWSQITEKPATFPVAVPSGGRPIGDLNGANVIGLRWGSGRPVMAVDGSELEVATYADVVAVRGIANSAQATANSAAGAVGSKADSFSGSNTVRHAQGPTGDAYNRNAGNNRFAVYMDESLQFGRNVSSRKYKEDIVNHDIEPAKVLALQPVMYHYKSDAPGVLEFGLIAEDTYETVPEVVTFFDGEIDGIDYARLSVAMLAVVKDQEARISALEARIEVLENPNATGQ